MPWVQDDEQTHFCCQYCYYYIAIFILSSLTRNLLKSSNSLMDLRNCGIDGDDVPKSVTVQRHSSFNRKTVSLKRLSRFVTPDSATNPVSTLVYHTAPNFHTIHRNHEIFPNIFLTAVYSKELDFKITK